MPKLKTFNIESDFIAGLPQVRVTVTVYVNAAGQFYCQIPKELAPCFDTSRAGWEDSHFFKGKNGAVNMRYDSFNELKSELTKAVNELAKPHEVKEKIIAYYIESKGSFAVSKDGHFVRNLTESLDASWFDKIDNTYSCMHGPYSLSIQAGVYWRVVRTLNGKTVETFENLPLNSDNTPDQVLNRWRCSPDSYRRKIIPYSDQAAKFFISLIEGMCHLNYLVQTATYDKEDLLKTINQGLTLLQNESKETGDRHE